MTCLRIVRIVEGAADEKQLWRFTFGSGQQHAQHFVKIYGTFDSARAEMFAKYGAEWCWQYSEKEWEDWEEKAKTMGIPIERELT